MVLTEIKLVFVNYYTSQNYTLTNVYRCYENNKETRKEESHSIDNSEYTRIVSSYDVWMVSRNTFHDHQVIVHRRHISTRETQKTLPENVQTELF